MDVKAIYTVNWTDLIDSVRSFSTAPQVPLIHLSRAEARQICNNQYNQNYSSMVAHKSIFQIYFSALFVPR